MNLFSGEDFWRWQTLNPNGYLSGTFETKTHEKRNGISNGNNNISNFVQS